MRGMPDYGRFCPVALSSEVLADRWTPLIVRELILGNTRFNDIARGHARASPAPCWPSGCATWSGAACWRPGRRPPGAAASTTSRRPARTSSRCSRPWASGRSSGSTRTSTTTSRPSTLMWWMHRRVVEDGLPPGRVIVEFDHTAPVAIKVWLVLDRGEPSVCMHHPGSDPDLVVRMATPTLARVFSGAERWSAAVANGDLEVAGPPALAKKLPDVVPVEPVGRADPRPRPARWPAARDAWRRRPSAPPCWSRSPKLRPTSTSSPSASSSGGTTPGTSMRTLSWRSCSRR